MEGGLSKIGRRLALLAGLIGVPGGTHPAESRGMSIEDQRAGEVRDRERERKAPLLIRRLEGNAAEMKEDHDHFERRQRREKAVQEATVLAISCEDRLKRIKEFKKRIESSVKKIPVEAMRNVSNRSSAQVDSQFSDERTREEQLSELWREIKKEIGQFTEESMVFFKSYPAVQMRGKLLHLKEIIDAFLDESIPIHIRDLAALRVEIEDEQKSVTLEKRAI